VAAKFIYQWRSAVQRVETPPAKRALSSLFVLAEALGH